MLKYFDNNFYYFWVLQLIISLFLLNIINKIKHYMYIFDENQNIYNNYQKLKNTLLYIKITFAFKIKKNTANETKPMPKLLN